MSRIFDLSNPTDKHPSFRLKHYIESVIISFRHLEIYQTSLYWMNFKWVLNEMLEHRKHDSFTEFYTMYYIEYIDKILPSLSKAMVVIGRSSRQ